MSDQYGINVGPGTLDAVAQLPRAGSPQASRAGGLPVPISEISESSSAGSSAGFSAGFASACEEVPTCPSLFRSEKCIFAAQTLPKFAKFRGLVLGSGEADFCE